MDAILVNLDLLLNYTKVSLSSYVSVGVEARHVKKAPFYEWLTKAHKIDIEEASELQVARDARLVQQLFDFKNGVKELGALDIVHLFVEAGAQVYVVSHETPEVLDALIARCGLSEKVHRLPMAHLDRRHETVSSIFSSETAPEWLLIYDLGLTPKQEQRIIRVMEGRGTLVSVSTSTATALAEDRLLKLIDDRWLIK